MPASVMPVSRPTMAELSKQVTGWESRPIASARVNAPIAAAASLGSLYGLRMDWIWRLLMTRNLSAGFSRVNRWLNRSWGVNSRTRRRARRSPHASAALYPQVRLDKFFSVLLRP